MEQLRKDYSKSILDESHLLQNPLDQFKLWFDEALESEISEPNAMILSTVGPDHKPSSRVVLLKNVNDAGFVFFTNYLSRKGRELQINENACLLFFWDKLERQVRIEGVVNPIENSLSDTYFYSRPVLSQIGSMISPQSKRLESRKELEEKFEYYKTHQDQIKRPEHWGGYCLFPEYLEFWQGRESRLHDRLIYQKFNTNWEIARLAP